MSNASTGTNTGDSDLYSFILCILIKVKKKLPTNLVIFFKYTTRRRKPFEVLDILVKIKPRENIACKVFFPEKKSSVRIPKSNLQNALLKDVSSLMAHNLIVKPLNHTAPPPPPFLFAFYSKLS